MRNFIPLLLFGLLVLISSCSDDIDVNAPWKDVTVVYGLLSKSDSVHMIKVNKAFLGEGSADELAMIRDSSEYNNANVVIEESVNGSLLETIVLEDTIVSSKESGDFYYPEQKVYYFQRELNPEATYTLKVSVDGKEEQVTASTNIIEDFSLSGGVVFGNSVVEVGFINPNGGYIDQNFSFNSVPAGKAYQLQITFYYDEYYQDGTSESKSIQWDYPNITAFNDNGGQSLNQEISGELFFQQIASKISPLEESAGVKHRKFLFFQFSMVIAGDELNTYLEVNAPTSSIVQDKPQYTNVENGIGIFSTRNTIVSDYEKAINQTSRVELYSGKYTGALGFCADQGIYACE